MLTLHLQLNHVPIFAAITGFALLVLSFVIRRSDLATAGLVACVIAGASVPPTFGTGHFAGPISAEQHGGDAGAIAAHLDAAIPALVATLIAGILATFALLRRRRDSGQRLTIASLIAVTVAAPLLVRAGHVGGTIRHPYAGAEPSGYACGPPRTSATNSASGFSTSCPADSRMAFGAPSPVYDDACTIPGCVPCSSTATRSTSMKLPVSGRKPWGGGSTLPIQPPEATT
jgi:hypothetical protein